MPNSAYLTEFGGLEVVEFPSRENYAPDGPFMAARAAPGGFAWRLRLDAGGDEESFGEYFGRFIAEVDTAAITALIVGDCWNPGLANDFVEGVRDALIAGAASFPSLTRLFFGEVVWEETPRLSWIAQTDPAPLLAAFPGLTELVLRGADHMRFGTSDGGTRDHRLAWTAPGHDALQRLAIQTHRLDPSVVRGLQNCLLPALEQLDLYLGSPELDGPSPDDLAPLLSGEIFPRLRSLSLRNTQDTDALVTALATAPLLPRLTALDLSWSTLTDHGARVLLDSPFFHHLTSLTLHHHYISPDLALVLRSRHPEITLTAPQPLDPDWYDDSSEWEPEPLYPPIN